MPLLKWKRRTFNHLPEGCILLDYFLDGYNFGIQGSNDSDTANPWTHTTGYAPYNTSSVEGTNYFDLSGTTWNGLPYGKFTWKNYGEYKSSHGRWYRNIPTAALDGYSVEMMFRLSDGTSAQIFAIGRMYNLNMLSSGGSSVSGYLYDNGSTSTNFNFGTLSTVIGHDSNAHSWHHFAYTMDSAANRGYIFLDGVLSKTVIPMAKSNINIKLYRNPVYSYNGSSYTSGEFEIAQLAVWNYAKYTASFTPSHSLIGLNLDKGITA